MIERIVGWAVGRPKTVVWTVAVLAIVGAILGARLRFDALPDVTGNQVLIITRAPGLMPEEVERLVTRPIELAVSGVPMVVSQRSISRYGLSAVTVVCGENDNLLDARQLVQ